MERRAFVKNLAAALALAPTVPAVARVLRDYLDQLGADLAGAGTDQAYWGRVRAEFSLREGLVHLNNGSIGPTQRRRALAEPLDIRPPLRRFEAPHFVQWLLAANPAAAADRASSTMTTTLDLELQRRVETLVEGQVY